MSYVACREFPGYSTIGMPQDPSLSPSPRHSTGISGQRVVNAYAVKGIKVMLTLFSSMIFQNRMTQNAFSICGVLTRNKIKQCSLVSVTYGKSFLAPGSGFDMIEICCCIMLVIPSRMNEKSCARCCRMR